MRESYENEKTQLLSVLRGNIGKRYFKSIPFQNLDVNYRKSVSTVENPFSIEKICKKVEKFNRLL